MSFVSPLLPFCHFPDARQSTPIFSMYIQVNDDCGKAHRGLTMACVPSKVHGEGVCTSDHAVLLPDSVFQFFNVSREKSRDFGFILAKNKTCI